MITFFLIYFISLILLIIITSNKNVFKSNFWKKDTFKDVFTDSIFYFSSLVFLPVAVAGLCMFIWMVCIPNEYEYVETKYYLDELDDNIHMIYSKPIQTYNFISRYTYTISIHGTNYSIEGNNIKNINYTKNNPYIIKYEPHFIDNLWDIELDENYVKYDIFLKKKNYLEIEKIFR